MEDYDAIMAELDIHCFVWLNIAYKYRKYFTEPILCNTFQGFLHESGSRYYYLLQSWFDGRPISIERRNKNAEGEPLTKHESDYLNYQSKIGDQLAEALYALHKIRIIHMDIKHSNILVNKDMKLKIIDFGLSVRASNYAHNLFQSPSFLNNARIVSRGAEIRKSKSNDTNKNVYQNCMGQIRNGFSLRTRYARIAEANHNNNGKTPEFIRKLYESKPLRSPYGLYSNQWRQAHLNKLERCHKKMRQLLNAHRNIRKAANTNSENNKNNSTQPASKKAKGV